MGPTDNRVMFAVVPGRMVVTVAPSMRKFNVSPGRSGKKRRRGIAIGVVTIVRGFVQYGVPFFRICTLPGFPVMPPSTRIINSSA